MKESIRSRPPLRLCALAVLSVALLFPAGAAPTRATETGTVVAWGCEHVPGPCSVPRVKGAIIRVALQAAAR